MVMESPYEEDMGWGHFSGLPEEEEGDAVDDSDDGFSVTESTRENRFASSRFGVAGGCVCASKKATLLIPGCVSTASARRQNSRKRLSDVDDDDGEEDKDQFRMTFNSELSLKKMTSNCSTENPTSDDEYDDDEDTTNCSKKESSVFFSRKNSHESDANLSRRTSSSTGPLTEVNNRRRRRSGSFYGENSIEARVRKRRDDFCGDRGKSSTAWDVEKWHVFASKELPDGDVLLKPAFAPRTASRFFHIGHSKGITVSFAMGAIRVASTAFDRYAQYELVVRIDGRPPSSTWRRYSAFRAFVASVAADSPPRQIVRTLSAWADAQDAKKIFRCTHPAYLIQRSYHFEHVLREALFELNAPSLLLAFFEPEAVNTLQGKASLKKKIHIDNNKNNNALMAASPPSTTLLASLLGVNDSRRRPRPQEEQQQQNPTYV